MISAGIITKFKTDVEIGKVIDGGHITAEIGRGGKSMVVVASTNSPVADTITEVVSIRVQIIVAGYDIAPGEKLAYTACESLVALEGMTVSDDNFDYDIRSIVVGNWPVLIRWQDAKVFSVNTVLFVVRTPKQG